MAAIIHEYDYRSIPDVEIIAHNSLVTYFSLNSWKNWVTNEIKNKLPNHNPYFIFVPMVKEYDITYPAEIQQARERFNMYRTVKTKTEIAILAEMKDQLITKLYDNDLSWITEYKVSYHVDVVYQQYMKIFNEHFRGLVIALTLKTL